MNLIKGAQFSECRKYRYALWRTWTNDSHVTFIGLNPSTADEKEDDPTIRRCMNYAKAWGFGGINMLNLFAFRATNPKEMMQADNAIGPENNHYLQMYLDKSGLTIACWGNLGVHKNRAQNVIEMLGKENLSILGLTKKGEPKHPLYLKRNIEPIHLW